MTAAASDFSNQLRHIRNELQKGDTSSLFPAFVGTAGLEHSGDNGFIVKPATMTDARQDMVKSKAPWLLIQPCFHPIHRKVILLQIHLLRAFNLRHACRQRNNYYCGFW